MQKRNFFNSGKHGQNIKKKSFGIDKKKKKKIKTKFQHQMQYTKARTINFYILLFRAIDSLKALSLFKYYKHEMQIKKIE